MLARSGYFFPLVLAIASAVADGEAAEPRKVALLVGVNTYQRRNFSNLRYAERDVTELAAELKKLGFATTLLLGSSEGASKATKSNVESALQRLLIGIGKDDTVLVALS